MPRVAEFAGILLYIYAADHNPPHVHAYYGEHEALLTITDGALLAGSLPGKQFRRASEYVVANSEFLMTKWKELNP